MDQATDQSSATASPEMRAQQPQDRQADALDHAAALAAWYFRQLTIRPYATELTEDFPIGATAHLKFRDGDTRGVMQFAEIAQAPITRAETAFGMHLDVYQRHASVLMRASTLILHGQNAQLDEQTPPPNPPTDAAPTAPAEEDEAVTVQPAPAVMPLGASITASVPAIAPTADGEQ
ncbi:hypothetical protein ACFY3G_02935 [Streptomyces phaeochromogenes]|uniref:hypothetical protein n=1 Tax=Streptomyces phaeochromogenes TaxID=1923 RepID=UPI0036BBCBEA